jgi:hypothetical protein
MRFVSDGPRMEFGARKPFAASEGTPYRPHRRSTRWTCLLRKSALNVAQEFGNLNALEPVPTLDSSAL